MMLAAAQLSRALPHASFRPDIEGLRALAVLGVVLFHAHLPGFGGGFIGVDVFFVISGYLICGLLHRELASTGRIDVVAFWLKRTRRLMPNAVATLLVTTLATGLLLPAYSFSDHAWSIAAAATYLGNVHFAAQATDYFVEDTIVSPVLHFWSLGVEEQFYILWPLMLAGLVLLFRQRALALTLPLIMAICIVSLALALTTIQVNQPIAFYHVEMRAWQLGLGGLIAVCEPRLLHLPQALRAAAGWLGLVGILSCMAFYHGGLNYPGLWALPPTLATGLVLMAPATAFAPAPLLSIAPLRWVGARSYSLYLWHWPALVFVGVWQPDSPWATAAGLAIGTLLALCAYHAVEQPLRFGPWWPRDLRFAGASAATAIALVLSAAALLASPLAGAGTRAPDWVAKVKQATADRGRNIKQGCNRVFDQIDQPLCAFGDPAAPRTVVLFGDSHAAQWFEAVDQAARSQGWRLLAWSKSACPAAEVTIWHRKSAAPFVSCDRWRAAALDRLVNEIKPDMVLISSFVESATVVWSADQQAVLPLTAALPAWRDGLVQTITRLQAAGIAPVVIADTPKARRDFKACLESGDVALCGRPRVHGVPALRPDHEAAVLAGVPLLDLTDRICNAKLCPAVHRGMIVYRDDHHLTARFAKSLWQSFATLLQQHERLGDPPADSWSCGTDDPSCAAIAAHTADPLLDSPVTAAAPGLAAN